MSNWIDVQGYDVATVNGVALVLKRGGTFYAAGVTRPAWREFCAATDLDAAWAISDAMNAELRAAVPAPKEDE